jgi:hypothetical protein
MIVDRVNILGKAAMMLYRVQYCLRALLASLSEGQ